MTSTTLKLPQPWAMSIRDYRKKIFDDHIWDYPTNKNIWPTVANIRNKKDSGNLHQKLWGFEKWNVINGWIIRLITPFTLIFVIASSAIPIFGCCNWLCLFIFSLLLFAARTYSYIKLLSKCFKRLNIKY